MWPRLSTSWSSGTQSNNDSLRLEERLRSRDPMTSGEDEHRSVRDVIYYPRSFHKTRVDVTTDGHRVSLPKPSSSRSASAQNRINPTFPPLKVALFIMITAAVTGLLLMLGTQFGFSATGFSEKLSSGVVLASSGSGDNDNATTFSGDVSNCPGYALTDLSESDHGLTARLQLAGEGCNAFGVDIKNLTIEVTYETDSRLHVHIYDTQQTQFQIPESVISRPTPPSSQQSFKTTSDLVFNYTSQPFAFWITRRGEDETAEPLFDTRTSSLPPTPIPAQDPSVDNSTSLDSFQLIFEDQYLQLASALPYDTNVYGLGEVVASSGIRRDVGANGGPGTIQTLWARDIADPIDENMYGSHPIYLEHRFNNQTQTSSSHGVFLLNSNGADILLQTPTSSSKSLIEYRFLGGTFDFYFLSGPTPQDVVSQYSEVVGLPLWIPYWAFGFHLCRWGYPNISDTKLQVERMREANIPLEVMWNDIDLYHALRDFTTDPVSFPIDQVREFIEELHANDQHYIPIVDAAVAKQANSTDFYDPYTRGVELDVWVNNPDGSEYVGQVWPGFTVFPDWFASNAPSYWTEALKNWSDSGVMFSGIWLDMNEVSSFCNGSCGSGIDINNTTVPFLLPGEPGNLVTDYPEGYNSAVSGPSGNITINGTLTFNAEGSESESELSSNPVLAARADIVYERSFKRESISDRSSSSSSQQVPSSADGSKLGAALLLNTPNEPLLNFPPYAIHNGDGPLSVKTIATNATHQPGYVEFDVHNMWGMMEEKTTHNALLAINPGQRPFLISRSTFPSSGKWTGHWLGDNFSKWQYMYYSIQGVLQFQIFQIPMVGADTGGFNGNTDEELLGRWMMLSAFHPFYRNHNEKGAIPQEPYRWESVANASRTAIAARYAMLPYWYTLFANASSMGIPPVRALFWEFPDEPELFGIDRQFMIGRDILVTPVLEPNVSSVQGIFPGRSTTTWRDWWTHAVVDTANGTNTNITLSAPIGHIPVHIRSGAAMLLHASPAYTTTQTRAGPYSLLISLDSEGSAFGTAYIDDGISLPPTSNVTLKFVADNQSVTVQSEGGSFEIEQKLAQVTVLGVSSRPMTVRVNNEKTLGEGSWSYEADLEKLVIGGTDDKSIDVSLNEGAKFVWSV